jgi:beta-lactamase family protein
MGKTTLVACAALLVALLGISSAQAAPSTQAAQAPQGSQPSTGSTAEQQLDWVVNASGRVPVSDTEAREHLAPVLLNAVGGTAGFNAVLANFGRLTIEDVLLRQPDHVVALVDAPADEYRFDLHVDGTGLIDGLHATIEDPPPTSWSQVDDQLSAIGARVSFAASLMGSDGRCHAVHGVGQDEQRPLGSAFKLYVLGALGRAVAEHRASWTEQLAIRDDWKSLPSGVLQNQPAGTRLPLSEYADKMISISDNTAADHLIHRLGRPEVQRQLFLFGNSRPTANIPFLTTKALFELKGAQYPARADAYLALPRPTRGAAVSALERQPLRGVAGWARPEKIDQIEWFGSPNDMCRAFSGLRQENDAEIDHALSINDGGLGLDRSRFPVVWFKGGSEPGVLTLNYLTRTAAGRTLVGSVMVSDPANHLDEQHVAGRALAIVKGAFQLMSG